MNEIFNPKAEQLQKNLATLNERLAQVILQPNDDKIRSLIDSRRLCLAQLQSEGISQRQSKQNNSTNEITNLEINNFIDAWCAQVRTAFQNPSDV